MNKLVNNWKQWFKKYPNGKPVKGTYAYKAYRDIKTGNASLDQYESMIIAALNKDL